MHPLLEIFLGNTLVAIVLSTLALLATLLKRPALAHALWVLVLVKLITPPIVRLPVAIPATASPVEPAAVSPIASPPLVVTEFMPDMSVPIPAPLSNDAERATIASDGGEPLPSLASVLVAAWMAGSIACAACVVARTARFRRLLRSASLADDRLVRVVARLAADVGLHRAPELRIVDGDCSPMIYFLFRRPTLILPRSMANGFAAERRDAVLAHELAHLRRRDHWVRLLEIFATVLLWWHPLLWLARRGVREAEEQCCDAWAVSILPDGQRRTYADALVDAVSLFSRGDGAAGAASLPPAASGLGQFKHLKRRLVMILSHRPARAMSPLSRILVLAMMLVLPIVPAVAQDAQSSKDEELKQLRERVQQLEERLARAEQELAANKAAAATQPAPAGATVNVPYRTTLKNPMSVVPAAAPAADDATATEQQRDAQRAKAKARTRQDAKKYTPEQMADAEQLYQVANKNWRAPEAITSLKQMIEKYPDMNRTGCAVLYLGQMSEGDTREEYLKRAVEKHSDCFYFNGTQVGGFGRYLLALYYKETGKPDEAKKLLQELITKYPDALTHRGQRLAPAATKELAAMSGDASPTQPAAK